MTPALLLAAPASGSGKTLTTLALLRAWRRRGVRVASFKIGPDYLDPTFHAAASGRSSLNLDPWAMRPGTVARVLGEVSRGSELVLGEGVMGLFDGPGSTADVAAALDLPVVLVLDVRAQAQSAAAVVRGFAAHRLDVEVAGVILNRVGSASHARMVTEALGPVGVPVLGAVPRREALTLPERHLGLVQAAEIEGLEEFVEEAATAVGEAVDLEALAKLARPPRHVAEAGPPPLPPPGSRVAVARDAAFAFTYPAVLEGWREAGAEVLPFSPLEDEPPDERCDAVYLPGGYPELHAGRLSACGRFLEGLRRAAARGAAVLGECGGYMALGEVLVDGAGVPHGMAGLLPLSTSFAERRLHLGYRRVETAGPGALGPAGQRFRGHEFHYATVSREGPAEPLFTCEGRPVGLRRGRVAGSFVHLLDREDPACAP